MIYRNAQGRLCTAAFAATPAHNVKFYADLPNERNEVPLRFA